MPSSKKPLDGLSVLICTPTHRDFNVQTVCSYLETLMAARLVGVPVDFHFHVSSLVHHSRTLAAHKFLLSSYNRLFWIDSDIVWEPLQFFALLKHTLKHDCVSGVYSRKRDKASYYVRMQGTQRDADGLLGIDGTGLGFCCVTRPVMETLAGKAMKLTFPGEREAIPHIFRCDDVNGEARGEDMAFFADVESNGFRVLLDPKIEVGHIGPKVFKGDFDTVVTRMAAEQSEKGNRNG